MKFYFANALKIGFLSLEKMLVVFSDMLLLAVTVSTILTK